MDGMANRLMRMEVAAQERIARTMTNVQKGSLIQALLYDSVSISYTANIQHCLI